MADLLPLPKEEVFCTAEYAPVCAETTNSWAITFSNECMARNASNFKSILFEWVCKEEENVIWMANPAAVNCVNKWWILEKDWDSTNCNIWWQTCEQWAYIRGECNIEVATKLETGWNTIYKKYTNNKSLSYKKALLSALNTKIEDLKQKEISSEKSTLYAHLLYLINKTSSEEFPNCFAETCFHI
jgi:putative hemolysin